MTTALEKGYATTSTDTGHEGGNASFAIGHPEKLIDFSYRAVHEMAVKSKAIMTAYYRRGPRLSYWTGCSTGGRQGLMAAQRYPEDFDGIIAGAPANNHTHLCAWRLARGSDGSQRPRRGCPAGQTRTGEQSRHVSVRRARRSQRRPSDGSAQVPFRSFDAVVPRG